MSGPSLDAAGTAAAGERVVEHATCLGCGCACDDIDVVVRDGRIVEARRACPLGVAWFGDGRVPARSRVRGRDVSLDDALDSAARLLAGAARPLVYLAPDISCEAQREAAAIADLLRATLDSVTSATAMPSILASQERGRAGGTLGEVRNRADVVVFWGVDPARRYPRFTTRYAPDPVGLFVPEGRRSRVVIAVDVGEWAGPADADLRVSIAASDEVSTLTALRALAETPVDARGANAGPQAGSDDPPAWAAARRIAARLTGAHYVALVSDAEPADGRERGRADAITALALALNGPTRCALCSLRGGGNRTGADAVLTWQSGFPAAVDYMRGFPRYRPRDGSAEARLARGEVDAALVVGAPLGIPKGVAESLSRLRCVVIGPRASEGALAAADVVADSAVAGIHTAGTALRLDDVPLPLRPSLDGPPDAASIVRGLRARVVRARRTAKAPTPSAAPAAGAAR